MRILVVEGDENHAQFITEGLRQAGHNIDRAADGRDGLFLATEEKYDAVVLERALPGLDGLAIVHALRSAGSRTPILILSALTKVEERIKGLRAGADDYVCKPFEFAELLARLEALARRNRPEQAEQTALAVADLEVNLLARSVKRANRDIDLQNKEFQLLEFLMRRVDQVVTRTMLLEGVWDFHFMPGTNLIDAQISKLRAKVDKPFGTPLVHTIKGAGYKLSAKA